MADTLKQQIYDWLNIASVSKRELPKFLPNADPAHYRDTLRQMQREGLIELVYVLGPHAVRPKGAGRKKQVQKGRPRHAKP